jgi:hydrogenase nickel incorporation protein HypA/HybF
MHELRIAAEIIDIVRGEMEKRNLTRLKEIGLRLGPLSGVDPEALTFSFQAATLDTPLAETDLKIELVPVNGVCRSCQNPLEIDDFVFICPACGSSDLDLKTGAELDIVYLIEKT